MKRIGVLFSSGVDSSALVIHYLQQGYTVTPVYVRSGLPWEKTELFWGRKFLKAGGSSRLHKLLIANIQIDDAYNRNWSKQGNPPSQRSRDSAVYLPARNLLLITRAYLALFTLKISDLAIGTLKGNPFQDGRRTYFDWLEKILRNSFQKNLTIHAPFRLLTKKQLIKRFRTIPWELTFSCINPKANFHCGKCNKCAERKRAFNQAS